MISKTTHRPDAHAKAFYNAWIVVLSLLTGISVVVAATLIGWPIFIHLLSRFTG